MSTFHFLPNMAERLTWFKDSPDPGDPGCLCSLCAKVIAEGEIPIRAFRKSDNTELRLHMDCAKQVIVEFAPRQPGSQFKSHPEFAEGRAAFLDAKRRASNPYSGQSTKGSAWYAGWDDAWGESHAAKD